jgi:hypothetical protein
VHCGVDFGNSSTTWNFVLVNCVLVVTDFGYIFSSLNFHWHNIQPLNLWFMWWTQWPNLMNSIHTKNLNPFEIGNEVMDSKVNQHLGLFALKKIPSQCFLRKCLFKCSRPCTIHFTIQSWIISRHLTISKRVWFFLWNIFRYFSTKDWVRHIVYANVE